MSEDRLCDRIEFWVLCLVVVRFEPAHKLDDRRNFTCRQPLAVADHDGNQAVAVILRAVGLVRPNPGAGIVAASGEPSTPT